MTDEKKTGAETEKEKPPSSQNTTQQNSSEGKAPLAKSTIELAEKSQKEAVSASPVERSTEKLKAGDISGLPDSFLQSYRGETGTAKWFKRLPVSMSTADLPPETPRWKVELIGLGSVVDPVGLEIVGDTVIGRGRVGTEPADLDLDMYGALEKGVSRRHGLLRPTTNHLYIIDLGSTNGTFHNGIPLGPGVARALKHNDTITLGRFSFTLKLIDGPTVRKTLEVGKPVEAPHSEETDTTKPLEPFDPAAIKAKKAKLTPPTFDPVSPGTTKLPDDEDTKPQPPLLGNEEKPSAPKAKSPIPDARSIIVGSQPMALQVSPEPEDKPSKPEKKTDLPAAEVAFSKEVTRSLDPDTKPVLAAPPTSDPRPAITEDKPPDEETGKKTTKQKAGTVDSAKPSATQEEKPIANKKGTATEKEAKNS
ncbi:MAG: FHA domain-containing protein [Anaerolineae bacterium]|nr:FHA domain-containing protein [Anaerolineae bacterium]